MAFHLVRLGLFQENGLTPDRANQVMLAVAKLKAQYRWLEPPASLGPLSVAAVEKAKGVEQHMALVRGWAAQMWEVWSPHHHTIRAWANAALQCGQPSG